MGPQQCGNMAPNAVSSRHRTVNAHTFMAGQRVPVANVAPSCRRQKFVCKAVASAELSEAETRGMLKRISYD